ncbi:MAG TPA: 16S rRNA (cytosine(967)-C(5))-methyltransferase RsmB [Clostridiaceae bacterium]
MDNCRKMAVEIVGKVLKDNAYSNILINYELKNSDLMDKDKALLTALVYGTIKYKLTIDYIIGGFVKKGLVSIDFNILNILRVSIFQLKYLDKVPDYAVVNEAVNLTKTCKKKMQGNFVNAILRNYLRKPDFYLEKLENYDLIKRLSIINSFEEWMIELLYEQYTDKVEEILIGLNKIPDLMVRVNLLKDNVENIKKELLEQGFNIRDGIITKSAIGILNGGSIEENPLYKNGYITVQDESAMLVSEAMDVRPGMQVLDLCSAPGGKATHLAELMDNTGRILACDLNKNKLKLVKRNQDRLGISNIETRELDARIKQEDFIEKWDRVLLDVPCSGLGIIGKKPEIKWNKSKSQLKEIIQIQRDILVNAAYYVKVNGILLYSTCTINKCENEDNIDWFTENNSNFQILSINFGNTENILYNDKGSITILPNNNMDGFFMAKLLRKK